MKRRIIACLATFLMLSAAARADDPSRPDAPAAETASPTRAELALFAMGLIGAVYRPGGDNPELGMDCSGFVRYVYHEVAGLHLPHNAAAISRISTVIHRTDLKPGDLVFFKTMRKAFSHVGIYLGNNRFIHASSSRTGVVMISSLSESYWAHRYDGARRVFDAFSPAASAAPLLSAPADSSSLPQAVSAAAPDPIARFAKP